MTVRFGIPASITRRTAPTSGTRGSPRLDSRLVIKQDWGTAGRRRWTATELGRPGSTKGTKSEREYLRQPVAICRRGEHCPRASDIGSEGCFELARPRTGRVHLFSRRIGLAPIGTVGVLIFFFSPARFLEEVKRRSGEYGTVRQEPPLQDWALSQTVSAS